MRNTRATPGGKRRQGLHKNAVENRRLPQLLGTKMASALQATCSAAGCVALTDDDIAGGVDDLDQDQLVILVAHRLTPIAAAKTALIIPGPDVKDATTSSTGDPDAVGTKVWDTTIVTCVGRERNGEWIGLDSSK